MKANREVKDSVFSLYFTEDTRRLVEAYNAIQGTDYPLDTPVEINTLKDVLYKDRINDISFKLDNRYVVLMEHQSTLNENMPVRMVIYLGRLYEKILASENIYRKKLIPLETPEFVVLYNGNQQCPNERILRLSEAFKDVPHENSIELSVKFLNIRHPDGNPVLQKSRSMWEYSTFIDCVYRYAKEGKSPEEAIRLAVLYCAERDIMHPFLEDHASEVENMLFTEWNWDDALRIEREEGREEGIKKGIEQGIEKGRKEGFVDGVEKENRRFLKALLDVLPDDVLAEKAGVSLSTITQMRNELTPES